jgi:hypothetical protein
VRTTLLSAEARETLGLEYAELMAQSRGTLDNFVKGSAPPDPGILALAKALESWPFSADPDDATLIAFMAIRNAIVRKTASTIKPTVIAITPQLLAEMTSAAFRTHLRIVADEITRQTVRGDEYNRALVAEFRSLFLVAFEPVPPHIGYVRASTLHPLAEAVEYSGARSNAGGFFPNVWVLPTGKYFKTEPECGSKKRATLTKPPLLLDRMASCITIGDVKVSFIQPTDAVKRDVLSALAKLPTPEREHQAKELARHARDGALPNCLIDITSELKKG